MAKKRLKMSTAHDIRRCINRISNMLLNGEIEPKAANAILYGCNIALSAIRVDEQQVMLEDLERKVKELGDNNGFYS